MRIPFPDRIPWLGAVGYALLIAMAQAFEHTDTRFILGCFLYTLLAVAGFNIAGGLRYPSGAFIFFNAVLSLEIGLIGKIVLGEPGESNLRVPMLTIAVYVVGMAMLVGAVIVARLVRPRRAVMAGFVNDSNLYSSYLAGIYIGLLYFVASGLLGLSFGSLQSAFNQINFFLPVGILLGVLWVLRVSRMRKTVTTFLGAMLVISALMTVVTFSKQTFFTPLLCWLLPVALMGYRLRLWHFVFGAILVFFTVHYVIPYTQYGRDYGAIHAIGAIDSAEYLLTHFDEVRTGYAVPEQNSVVVRYYDDQEGLLDRLNMISADDALVEQGYLLGNYGYLPITEQMRAMVPHLANADFVYYGNVWARGIGMLAPEDTQTGISFGFSAEAYREGGWFAVTIVTLLIATLLFCGLDTLWGDARVNPMALFMIVFLAHDAPERGLAGMFFILSKEEFALIVLALLCAYVLPVLASVFIGSGVQTLEDLGATLTPQAPTGAVQGTE